MPIVNWITQDNQHRSPNESSERTENLYTEVVPGGKSQKILIGCPGSTTYTKVPLSSFSLLTIQGSGQDPNIVTINTSTAHNLSVGQVFNITGTTNYNEINMVVVSVPSTTKFTYSTSSNTQFVAETVGNITPTGESPFVTVDPKASCRGLHTTATGRVFTVYESQLFEVLNGGTYLSRGSVAAGISQISMADDGLTLVIVDGTSMFNYTLATNYLLNITSTITGFSNPTKVVFSNQRIVCINNDPSTQNFNKFFWCEILDADNWPALNFASAESSADPIIGMEVSDGNLWFFGPKSYEVWRPGSNPDLPFNKVGGTGTEIGCTAPNSISTISSKVFFIGSSRAGNNVIFGSNGLGVDRISTHSIETQLEEASTTDDAISFTYQQSGHTFYVLTLVTANKTFVYDLTTNEWHVRTTRAPNTNEDNRYDPIFSTFAFGKVLVGTLSNARLLTLDLEKYTEWDGRPIVRLHQGPIYFDNYQTQFHREFVIDIETGVGQNLGEPYSSGIQTNQGYNPQIMLQYSDDSGHTWGNELWTDLGKAGEYTTRARWRRLGRARNRVYRMVVSSPNKVIVIGARLTTDTSVDP